MKRERDRPSSETRKSPRAENGAIGMLRARTFTHTHTKHDFVSSRLFTLPAGRRPRLRLRRCFAPLPRAVGSPCRASPTRLSSCRLRSPAPLSKRARHRECCRGEKNGRTKVGGKSTGVFSGNDDASREHVESLSIGNYTRTTTKTQTREVLVCKNTSAKFARQSSRFAAPRHFDVSPCQNYV